MVFNTLISNLSITIRNFLLNDIDNLNQFFKSEKVSNHLIFKGNSFLPQDMILKNISNNTANQLFAIIINESLCGIIQIYDYNKTSKTVYLGYFLKTEHQNKGIASKIILNLTAYLSSSLDISSFLILTKRDNNKSIALCKKIGSNLRETVNIFNDSYYLFELIST